MKSKPISKLEQLFEGCSGTTTSYLPDGTAQTIEYGIGKYGLRPIKVQ